MHAHTKHVVATRKAEAAGKRVGSMSALNDAGCAGVSRLPWVVDKLQPCKHVLHKYNAIMTAQL